MDSDELEELQHYFDRIIQASSIVDLEYCRRVIQALIPEYAAREKPERGVEKVNREYKLRGWHILEQIASDRISSYHIDSEIAHWERELSSADIDSAPPRVHPMPSLDVSSWPTDSPPSSPRKYAEERLQAGKGRMRVQDHKILEGKHKFAELMKFLKSNEIPKKPAAESVQMDNLVSTSTSSQNKPVGPFVERPASVPASPEVRRSERVDAFLRGLRKDLEGEFNRDEFCMVADVDSAELRRWQRNSPKTSKKAAKRIEDTLVMKSEEFRRKLNSQR